MISLNLSVKRTLLCLLGPLVLSSMLTAGRPTLNFALPAVSAGEIHLPARVYTLPDVAQGGYWEHVVMVKTKSAYTPDKSALSLQSIAWQQSLSPLSVRSIRAPFQNQASSGPRIQSADPFGVQRIFEIRYDVDIDPYDVCATLAQNPDVEYVSPVFKRYTFSTPNDPQYSSQWALAKIQASQAWDIGTGSASMVIADVDSGVDFEHEDLAAHLWNNPGELGTDSQGRDKRTNGVDDDKNGFIDDYRGWDFIGNITAQEAFSGVTRPDNDPKVRNSNMDAQLNHGTATTGCATAVTNNSKGIAGTGYQCKYLPIKCGSDQFGTAVMFGYEGIAYAAKLGAKVINCSWGGPGNSQVEQDLINDVVSKGSLIVVAAGNSSLNMDDSLQFPACYNNVLTVGATNQSDKRADFSNYGKRVDVYAPGTGILSTQSPNKYTAADGTSFSCPIVAGLCGLVRSMHPEWSPKQVMHQLRSTCDNVVTTNQSLRPQYYGRVNAYRALNENKSLTTGTTPGLEISSMSFDGKAFVESPNGVPAVFNVRNYLGRADNAVITITPVNNAIKLSQTSFNVSVIPAEDSVGLQCTLTAADPTYFKSNSIEANVVMTSGSYTNYQTITIVVNLSSEASYSKYATTPAVSYTGAFAKAPVTFWAIGKTSSNRKVVLHGTSIDSSLSDDLSCISAVSTQSALVGTTLGRVFRTTNGTSSWTNTSVSSITPRPLNISMADNNNGVLLGNPASGSWNVGVTTDGGATWTKSTTIASALSGETAQNSSIVWVGDNVWIGTSAGRVFYSTNRGQSWQTSSISGAAVLSQMAFSSNKLGYAFSRPTASLFDAVTVYVTLDGGVNWGASGYSFPASGIHPVYAYAPPNSTQCVIVASGSEVVVTTDTAKHFRPIVSENGLTATAGYGISTSSTVTLYVCGKTIGVLKFPLLNGSGSGVLTVPTTIQFDTLVVGNSQTKSVQVQNSGTAALSVSTYNVTPTGGTAATDFVLSGSVSLLNAGESGTLFVKFAPGTVGRKTATLTINSSVSTKTVNLIGVGRDIDNAVEDSQTTESLLHVYPNPSTVLSVLELQNMQSEQVQIRLVDLRGTVVKLLYDGVVPSNSMQISLSAEELASGMYVCEAFSARGIQRCMLHISH